MIAEMKRKIVRRNKLNLSLFFSKRSAPAHQFDNSEITYSQIADSKKRGQLYHEQRVNRSQNLNKRQLKKYSKKLKKSGLVGSNFSGICPISLKPASATYRKGGVGL